VTTSSAGAPYDVSVVVLGHREGDLCRPTFRALARSIEAAQPEGLRVEVIGVLDRADAATAAVFEHALGEEGEVGRLADSRVVLSDQGDPGLARNVGVSRTRGDWVCVLDGDNLVTRSWVGAAHRVATEFGGPGIVHPEQLVIFGDRWQVWPQLSTTDQGFEVHNFYDRTYWDTFCLAAREVFELVPYVATSSSHGLGPEDWHWGMETTHAGFTHVTAPGTALLYRSRPRGSVQAGHDAAHSLLPPARLLTDQTLATAPLRPPHESRTVEWRGLQRAVVRRGEEGATGPPHRLVQLVEATAGRTLDDSELATITSSEFEVAHYRALNHEPLRLGRADAVLHYLETGRVAGLRARLTADELADVARLDLTDYRSLHPDLTPLGDDDLLHHYLVHGRAERRATTLTTEQRDSRAPVALTSEMVAELHHLHELEPEIPRPDDTCLAELRRTGPPSDGSTTAGSRAWWRVVAALGPLLPTHLVFASHAPRADQFPPSTSSADRTAFVITGDAGSPASSTDPRRAVLELARLTEWRGLSAEERQRLLAMLVVQCGVRDVEVRDSPEFSAALRTYGRTLHRVASISHASQSD
jgi:hypothetical protein